jgi:hypothetical protein
MSTAQVPSESGPRAPGTAIENLVLWARSQIIRRSRMPKMNAAGYWPALAGRTENSQQICPCQGKKYLKIGL